jgi:hypothetical protein
MLFSGFFAYQNKKYGNMFVAVQTYTKKIFACPIKNLKIESFMKALETMKKVNDLFSPHPFPAQHENLFFLCLGQGFCFDKHSTF